MKKSTKAIIAGVSASLLIGGLIAGGILLDRLNEQGKISLFPTSSSESSSLTTESSDESSYSLSVSTDQHGIVLKTVSQSPDRIGRPRRLYSYSVPPTTTADQSIKIEFDWAVISTKKAADYLSVEVIEEDSWVEIIALRYFSDPIEITMTSKEDSSKYAKIEVFVSVEEEE